MVWNARNPEKKECFNKILAHLQEHLQCTRVLVFDNKLNTSRRLLKAFPSAHVVVVEKNIAAARVMRRMVCDERLKIDVVDFCLPQTAAESDAESSRGLAPLRPHDGFDLVVLDSCANMHSVLQMLHRLFHGRHLQKECNVILGSVARNDLKRYDKKREDMQIPDDAGNPISRGPQYRRSAEVLPQLATAYYGEHLRGASWASAFPKLCLEMGGDQMAYCGFTLVDCNKRTSASVMRERAERESQLHKELSHIIDGERDAAVDEAESDTGEVKIDEEISAMYYTRHLTEWRDAIVKKRRGEFHHVVFNNGRHQLHRLTREYRGVSWARRTDAYESDDGLPAPRVNKRKERTVNKRKERTVNKRKERTPGDDEMHAAHGINRCRVLKRRVCGRTSRG